MPSRNFQSEQSAGKSWPKKYHSLKPKLGRGWIAVNMSKHDILLMRKLARANGSNFRLFCEKALRKAAGELREKFGLSFEQSCRLTRGQIDALAERTRLGRRLVQTLAPEKN